MNINRKLPPSPNSTVCRKPLFSITSVGSVQQLKKQQIESLSRPQQSLSYPRSSKNTRTKVLIDEQNRPILKAVHCRKNNSSNSLESSHLSPKKRNCKNHKNKIAMHQLDFDKNQYLCVECSLFYAKQGYKIKIINSASLDNDRLSRQKQTNQYLQKCGIMQSQIINWKKKQNQTFKLIYEQFSKLIISEKEKMEIQIVKIRQIYCKCIKNLEQTREDQINSLRKNGIQIQKISKSIQCTKSDIQRNYEDCIKSFTCRQFREIMDEYWKQITNAQLFISEHSVTSIIKDSTDLKLSIKTMEKSDNNTVKDFTFSKEKKFQTPPFSKQIRGIKFAQSQPDSNRYESSLKESIVDSKIILNDFTL